MGQGRSLVRHTPEKSCKAERGVPGNAWKGILGLGGAADPPRAHMSEPRWCKSRAMGTIEGMASVERV